LRDVLYTASRFSSYGRPVKPLIKLGCYRGRHSLGATKRQRPFTACEDLAAE